MDNDTEIVQGKLNVYTLLIPDLSRWVRDVSSLGRFVSGRFVPLLDSYQDVSSETSRTRSIRTIFFFFFFFFFLNWDVSYHSYAERTLL